MEKIFQLLLDNRKKKKKIIGTIIKSEKVRIWYDYYKKGIRLDLKTIEVNENDVRKYFKQINQVG